MTITFDTSITDGNIDGTGAFDVLMRSVRAHLELEYKSNRIRDEDYATVYLGAIQSAMGQAIQFVLGKEQAETAARLADLQFTKSDAEIALLQQQLKTEKAQTEPVEEGLMGMQQDVMAQEILNKQAQVLLSERQAEAELYRFTDTTEGLIGKQQAQIEAETELTKQRLITETAQVEDVSGGILGKQLEAMEHAVTKGLAEVDLMKQKVISEKAQTTNVAGGVIGKQQMLYERQAEGFLRDAEQKVAGIYAQAFAVQRSTDSEFSSVNTGLEKPQSAAVMEKLRKGIGVTV